MRGERDVEEQTVCTIVRHRLGIQSRLDASGKQATHAAAAPRCSMGGTHTCDEGVMTEYARKPSGKYICGF